jgi:predicted RNase H-like HicB family nuclease
MKAINQQKMIFTSVFQKTDNWYLGWVEEISGVNTQGKTLKEALSLIIQTNRELNQSKTKQINIIKEPLSILV